MLILCHRAFGGEFLGPADLAVLDRPADTMMRDYLTAMVDEQFARRTSRLAALKTAGDWDRHAAFIRESMREWTGPFTEIDVRAASAGILGDVIGIDPIPGYDKELGSAPAVGETVTRW